MEGDQAILFRRFLLNIANYYRSSIESSMYPSSHANEATLPQHQQDINNSSVGQYLTADQAMTVLRQQIKRLIKLPKLNLSKRELVPVASWYIFKIFSHPSFHEQMRFEDLESLVHDEEFKMEIHQKYKYREADNPDDFFVPFIWRNIVSSVDLFCLYSTNHLIRNLLYDS